MHVEVSTNVHVMMPRQQYGWRVWQEKCYKWLLYIRLFIIFIFYVFSHQNNYPLSQLWDNLEVVFLLSLFRLL